MKKLFFVLLTFFTIWSAHGQNYNLSIGTGVGTGFPLGANSTLKVNNDSYSVTNNLNYAPANLFVQITKADKLGIETGFSMQIMNFTREEDVVNRVANYLGFDPSIGLTRYRLPVQFIYIIPIRGSLNRVKLTAGASANWNKLGYVKTVSNAPVTASSDLLFGCRLAGREGRLGRIEIGLEYQRLMQKRLLVESPEPHHYRTLSTKTNSLFLNLYFFFLNRKG